MLMINELKNLKLLNYTTDYERFYPHAIGHYLGKVLIVNVYIELMLLFRNGHSRRRLCDNIAQFCSGNGCDR